MNGSKLADFEFVTRLRVLTHEEYWFELDEYRRGADQFLLAHIRFARFSPAILKRVLREWKAFRLCVTAPLYAVGETDDAKFERFVSLLGFTYLNEVICNNGVSRRLFIST